MTLDLLVKIDEVVDYFEPPNVAEVKPNDRPLGVAGMRLMALSTVISRMIELNQAEIASHLILLGELMTQRNKPGFDEKKEIFAFRSKIKEIETRRHSIDTLRRVLAQELHEKWNDKLNESEQLDIRKGWIVVAERKSLVDMIDDLMTGEADPDSLKHPIIDSILQRTKCDNPNCPIHGTEVRRRQEANERKQKAEAPV